MAKMTISELSTEMKVDVEKIIKYVNDKGIEAKTGRKSLDDDQVLMVKNAFIKKKPATKPNGGEEKKKSKPIMVFRPQNTKDGHKNGSQNRGPVHKPNANSKPGQGFRPTDNNGRKISFSERASRREEAKEQAEERARKAKEAREAKEAQLKNQGDKQPREFHKQNSAGKKPDFKKSFDSKRSNDSKRPNDNKKNDNFKKSSKPNVNVDIPTEKQGDRKHDSRKKKITNAGNQNGATANYNKRRGRKDKPVYDENERQYKHPKKNPNQNKQKEVKEEEPIKLIQIPQTISIQDLAAKMKIQPSTIIKNLFLKGKICTMNEEIEFETAEEIALDFEVLVEHEKEVDLVAELLEEAEELEENLVKRPPVVCVMGHVDHGKTSLLDAIRKTNVTSREAGGITQHIGAYTVECNGEQITFLDTPGHEAFTAMRLRGAQSTDIAILVVAADDGVMPQTVEAINHAKAAGTEIIVAVNKMDKPGASLDRVKQELAEHEILAEDWGGKTAFCPISAKTGQGIDDLLEMLLLTAEVMELKANPDRTARGVVIESKLDKGKGTVATVLVQKGTLHVGDAIAAGGSCGKVRAMVNDKGVRVKEAGPSTPVSIIGLNEAPSAGEIFLSYENDKDARNYAETFISQEKMHKLAENKSRVKMSLDDLYTQIQEGNLKELDIVVKADVQGSVEAIRQSLEKLSNDEVVVKVIHGGVGNISESDVNLAAASGAIIIGFNVKPDSVAQDLADNEEVDLRLYSVIYNAIEDVEYAMKGMLAPVYEEKVIGEAEIRQLFKASGVGTIAGSYVTDGLVQKNATYRVYRDKDMIFEGALNSLKRFKDDVKEVKAGYECGFVFDNFNDLQEGDRIQAYIMVEVPRQ